MCKVEMVRSAVCAMALLSINNGVGRLTSRRCLSANLAIMVHISLQQQSRAIVGWKEANEAMVDYETVTKPGRGLNQLCISLIIIIITNIFFIVNE